MNVKFENSKLKIEFIDERISDSRKRVFIFRLDINDFDTPQLNIEYESEEELINRIWIDEETSINVPKSHVAYKIFTLLEYEVTEIIKFMIKHL